ncbi:MAG: uroporphyrinogen decarboxylase family protein [Victivallales bacterium]|nr:uroporphyrinogen decarboxylase family protein [Victivallales bacterium]
MQEMTSRERFNAVLNFEPFDRLPVVEWATWWNETVKRWESEGLPQGMDNVERQKYFGLDLMIQDWIPPRHPNCPVSKSHGAGIIATPDEYDKLKAEKMFYNLDALDLEKWRKWKEIQKRGNAVLWLTLEGFFWYPRSLFGIENHLLAFYDYPEVMHRMNQDAVDFYLKIIDRLCQICKPDFMTFAEDMSYNKGPMLSEALFDEFMMPYYQQLVPRLKEYGIKIIVDSDGDITKCASWFERAGVDGILPLERQAKVDVALLRQQHPKQIYIGAYDKIVMNKGETAMRTEFERLLPTARQGGFIISCDHQTPPAVSLTDYQLYLKLFREYAILAAR